jgi:hypothetical protein
MTPQPPTAPFSDEPVWGGTAAPDPETPTVERTSVLADFPEAPRAAVEQRWQAFARLMTVGAVSLAPLVRVAPLPDGVMLTHRVPAGAVALGDLRATGPLRAGHVLTVAVAVADALVALAEDGLAHGGVGADQVLVGPDGAVVLGGCGLAWHRAPADVDGPRIVDDVAALGELVRDLLGTGSSPSSLVLAALRAADPDPALRPSPLELLGLLRRCGRADPLLDLLWTGRSEPPAPGPVRVEAAEPTPVPVVRALPDPPRRSALPPRESVPRTSATRLRIDPRTAPEPVEEATSPVDMTAPEPERPARRAGTPRRPAARERRSRSGRGWRGPLVLVVVTVLAALALAAVRVGALAMADGPVAIVPAVPVETASVTGDATPESSVSRTTADPEPTASVSGLADPVDPTVAGLDLDRGPATDAPDWPALLATADAGRQRALESGDAIMLADWVDPDGSAWSADAALAARVSAAAARIEGGALVVLDVRPRHVTGSEAVLLVRDRRETYTVVTTAGTSDVAARAPRWWQVTLRRTSGSDGAATWRIRDVAPVAAPAR